MNIKGRSVSAPFSIHVVTDLNRQEELKSFLDYNVPLINDVARHPKIGCNSAYIDG